MKARTVLAVLLLVNVGLAGALAWQLHAPAPPAPLPKEEGADRVRLEAEAPLAAGPTPLPPAAAPVAPAEAQTPAAEEEPPPEPAPASVAAASTASVAAAPVCATWGDFTAVQWSVARGQLQRRLGRLRIEERADENKARYWVHIPPRASLDAARDTLAQLKAKGITDAFVIQDGSEQQFAISLGLFSKKVMADTFLKHLHALEIGNAVSRPHPQSRYISVFIQGIPAERRDALRSLAAGFEKTAVEPARCGAGG